MNKLIEVIQFWEGILPFQNRGQTEKDLREDRMKHPVKREVRPSLNLKGVSSAVNRRDVSRYE